MNVTMIQLAKVTTPEATRAREAMCQEAIAEYSEALKHWFL